MILNILNVSQLELLFLLRYDLFAKYLRPYTYTILHQRRSTKIAAILRGKLIGGYMIKIRFEWALQYIDKNSRSVITSTVHHDTYS